MPDVEPYEPLIGRFTDHLRVVRNLAAATVRHERHYVTCFLAWWTRSHPGVGLEEVRARHLADHLVAEAVRGISPATVYAEVNALRTFFRWLVAEGELAADPSATLSPPKRNPNRVDVYTPGEMAAVLAHTATLTELRGRQRHAIIATLRYTGARAGEVSGLRRDRIDLDARRLEVLGKGSRHRTIAIPAPLGDVLEVFIRDVRPELPDTPYLFVNTHALVPDPHLRCSVSALQRETRLAAQGAGLPGRHYPHRWRHSLATELIRAGVGVAHVQRQLGHASIVSTMIYTHLDVDDVRRSLDGVFGPGIGTV
ncbi:MAG: tyrosine-type recombinase/integrase [Acidimicrobiia bacterium]|nr:tyrosine-type recombinase/integrase [Acidimicrobiia bacterium]